jgi:hypothetical protein
MIVSRRTYLLVSLLGAVVPIGVAASMTTLPGIRGCGGVSRRLPRCARVAAPHRWLSLLAITGTWQQGLANRRRLSGLWRCL